jgi:hypothetical protein
MAFYRTVSTLLRVNTFSSVSAGPRRITIFADLHAALAL